MAGAGEQVQVPVPRLRIQQGRNQFRGFDAAPARASQIVLGDDGQLIVDKAFRYQYELGQWTDPQAYVKYVGV